jgi:predicted NAD-dependent protein-ADP-ribosyltransferase YbiA (DUF1768 family)
MGETMMRQAVFRGFFMWAVVVVAVSTVGVLALAADAGEKIERDPKYPANWWTPVDKSTAPRWEILPQEAGEGEVILSKRNELGVLSNFAPAAFTFHGKRYASLEGFWQMMKYPEGDDDERTKLPGVEWRHTRDEVAEMTAWEAKRAGDQADAIMRKLKIDWVTFEGKQMEYRPGAPGDHYHLIVEATREKVKQNSEVKEALLSTGDLVLRPDHHQGKSPPAAWRYYDILTEIRHELQQEPQTEKAVP